MSQDSEQYQSIRDKAAETSHRLSVRMGMIGLSIVFILWSSALILLIRTNIDTMVDGIRSHITKKVEQGLFREVKNEFAPLVRSQSFAGVSLWDPSRSVALVSFIDPKFKNTPLSSRFGGTRFHIQGSKLLYSRHFPLSNTQGQVIGSLQVWKSIPYLLLGISFLAIGALILGLIIQFRAVLNRFSQSFSTPVEKFRAYLSGIHEYSDASQPDNVRSQLAYSELVSTFDSFQGMLKNLQESNRREKMHERDIAVGKLASQVAHDIKSPLMALEILSQEVKGLHEEEKNLISLSIERIKSIASDLKKEFLTDTKKPVMTLTKISQTIADVIAEKKIEHSKHSNVRLIYHTHSSAINAVARLDEDHFKRILSNMINNSKESIDQSGEITVSLGTKDKKVVIEVKDQGRGIPKEILPKVTERGFSYGKKHGSGLGLYHARETIESWNGRFAIASREGAGTRVRIELGVV